METYEDELDRHGWHLERFDELGYPWDIAEQLDRAGVDWHELKRLLDAGCPPDLARLILT